MILFKDILIRFCNNNGFRILFAFNAFKDYSFVVIIIKVFREYTVEAIVLRSGSLKDRIRIRGENSI